MLIGITKGLAPLEFLETWAFWITFAIIALLLVGFAFSYSAAVSLSTESPFVGSVSATYSSQVNIPSRSISPASSASGLSFVRR